MYLYSDICYLLMVCALSLYIDKTKPRLTNEDKSNGSYLYNLSVKHIK